MKYVIKKSRFVLSIALVLTIALSQIISLSGFFLSAQGEPGTTLSDLQALYDIAEEKAKDPTIYNNQSFAKLSQAMKQAKALLDGGYEDGEAKTVPVVGAYNDPNWEVSTPAGDYAKQFEQTNVIGAKHMEFSQYGASGVKATYLKAAIGKYDQWNLGWNGYGNITFRYNRTLDPLPVDLTKDTLNFSIKSSLTSDFTAPQKFLVYLGHKDNNGVIQSLSVTYMVEENNYSVVSPKNGTDYTVTIKLSDFLENGPSYSLDYYGKDYVNDILKPLNYKINIEYITVSQDLYYNTEEGITFAINEFSLNSMVTGVAEACNKLRTALDRLEKKVTIDELREVYERYSDEYKDAKESDFAEGRFAQLQNALRRAEAVIDAEVPDGTIVNYPLVGAYNDTKWEVKNPITMGGYTPQDKQVEVFTGESEEEQKHISFFDGGQNSVRATFLDDAYGKYGTHVFGHIDFRYNHSENPIVVNFINDKLYIDVRSVVYPGMAPAGNLQVELIFNDLPSLTVPFILSGYTGDSEGFGSTPSLIAEYQLSDFLDQSYAQSYVDTYLAPNDYKAEIKYIRIAPELIWRYGEGHSVFINQFSLDHASSDVEDAKAALEDVVAKLYLAELSVVGNASDPRWEVKNPIGMQAGYTPQNKQVEAFGAKHMSFLDEDGSFRATYEQAATGKYGESPIHFGLINFRFNYGDKPAVINFNDGVLSVSFNSVFLLDPRVGYPFYVDLYFKGISQPLRLSLLNSTNGGYTQGGIYKAEIELSDFLKNGPDDWKAILNKNKGVMKLERVLFSQDIYWNGDTTISFIINKFSIIQTQVPPDIFLKNALSLLSEREITFADRYEIIQAKKMFDELSADEKKKVSSQLINQLDKYLKMVADVEKTAYMFPVFDSVNGWVTNNATNPESEATLQNTYGPITEKTAYLKMSGKNGGLVVSATGKSLEHKAYWGGAIIGWNYLKHTFDTAALIDIENSSLYFDIDSAVEFRIMIHFSEGSSGISIPFKFNNSGHAEPGVHTGVINLKEYISSLPDSTQKALALKNKKKALISSIDIIHVNDSADPTKELNIRTLAMAKTKHAIAASSTAANYPNTGENIILFGKLAAFVVALPACIGLTYFGEKIRRGKNRKGGE